MRAAWKGAKQAFDEFGVTIRFLLDHVRSFPMERCLETVKWCDEFRQFGVVGLGLAGPEKGWPSSTYKEALNLAEQLEVPFVPHAGEETDSGDIWDALEFSPKRIGHGLSSSDDERLLEELRRASIMVEVCPTSNVVLNHVENFGTHPARRLFDAGVPISLNSDDPPMFGTSLLREYALAYTDLGFSLDDLRAVARMSLEHALVGGRTKEELLAAAEQG
jgi:adenosine deaminase